MVCGGRDLAEGEAHSGGTHDIKQITYYSVSLAMEILQARCTWGKVGRIIHGGASGADLMAGVVGKVLGIPVETFPAEWDKFGKSAGPIRNQHMAKLADMCIALPGGKGTEDMKRKMRSMGKEVREVK